MVQPHIAAASLWDDSDARGVPEATRTSMNSLERPAFTIVSRHD